MSKPFELQPQPATDLGDPLPVSARIQQAAKPTRLLVDAEPRDTGKGSAGIPLAMATLAGLQLTGEVLRQTLHIPLPGPLIGMALLTVLLVARGSTGPAAERAVPPALLKSANGLIAIMGLLFVPAGVGIIAELGILRQDWIAILAGLVVSTLLGLAVTGLVLHHLTRTGGSRSPATPIAARQVIAQ